MKPNRANYLFCLIYPFHPLSECHSPFSWLSYSKVDFQISSSSTSYASVRIPPLSLALALSRFRSIRPNQPSLLLSPLDGIQFTLRANDCKFLLVGQHLSVSCGLNCTTIVLLQRWLWYWITILPTTIDK